MSRNVRSGFFSQSAGGWLIRMPRVDQEFLCRYDCVPMRKKGKFEGDVERTAETSRCGLATGDQLSHDQAVDLQEENSKRSDCGRTSSYPTERSRQIAFQNPWQDRATTQRRIRRVSGRNQLVGRIEYGSSERSDGRSKGFHRRSANHLDYHCAFRQRNAAEAGADRCRAHKSYRSDDSARLT